MLGAVRSGFLSGHLVRPFTNKRLSDLPQQIAIVGLALWISMQTGRMIASGQVVQALAMELAPVLLVVCLLLPKSAMVWVLSYSVLSFHLAEFDKLAFRGVNAQTLTTLCVLLALFGLVWRTKRLKPMGKFEKALILLWITFSIAAAASPAYPDLFRKLGESKRVALYLLAYVLARNLKWGWVDVRSLTIFYLLSRIPFALNDIAMHIRLTSSLGISNPNMVRVATTGSHNSAVAQGDTTFLFPALIVLSWWSISSKKSSGPKRVAAILLMFLYSYAAMVGLFRATFIMLILGLGLILLLTRGKRGLIWASVLGLVILLIAPDAIFVRFGWLVDPTTGRLSIESDESLSLRLQEFWPQTFRFALRHLPWGAGLGMSQVKLTSGSGRELASHNEFLLYFAETGPIGLAVILWFLYQLYMQFWSSWRQHTGDLTRALSLAFSVGTLSVILLAFVSVALFHEWLMVAMVFGGVLAAWQGAKEDDGAGGRLSQIGPQSQ